MTPEERYSRNRLAHNPTSRRRPLNKGDVTLILDYLKNPTRVGVVKLEGKWIPEKGITEDISELSGKSKTDPRIMVTRRAEQVARYSEEITSLLTLFRYFVRVKNKIPKDSETRYADDAAYLLEDIDVKPILRKYKEQIEYFEKNLYLDAEPYGRRRDRFIRLKSGIVIINRNTSRETPFIALSLDHKALDHLRIFLELIGKVEDTISFTTFSPEEELLEPYIDLMGACLGHVLLSATIKQYFEKTINDYYDGNYTGAVSTSSLVAEECLSQLFESIAREPVPKSLTLGQLSQKIGTTARNIDAPESITQIRNKNEILKRIAQIKEGKDIPSYIQTVMKTVLTYVDQHDQNLKSEWVKIKKGDVNYSLFPNLIKSSLDDLISYRNAASHKSTDPIDSLKALKSIYASLSLALWWETARKTIDGSKSIKENYDGLVTLAKAYS